MFQRVGSKHLLSFTVQEQIEQAIKDRRLPPGEKLPTEMKLCEKFGVSRTVMREALRILSTKGLISVEKGRGMFVREISASSVSDPMHLYLTLNLRRDYAIDVVHARQAIEPSIAAMAAVNRSEEMVGLLRENLQTMKELKGTREDFGVLATLDSEFHLLIAKASNNPIMPLVIEPIHRLMPQIKLAIYDAVNGARDSAVEHHGNIIAAIAARDEHGARTAMQEHLRNAEEHIRAAIGDSRIEQTN